VPFFGDQPFWGEMIARAGAGPDPCVAVGILLRYAGAQVMRSTPSGELNAERLADALRFCGTAEAQAAAQALGAKIRDEVRRFQSSWCARCELYA
jgi:hypothetical protein